MNIKRGIVYLIGAGPGDPELITVRGMNLLKICDVIIYDRLASPELLEHVKPEATLIKAGKAPGRHTMTQEEINATMIQFAEQGNLVCRLKGGDPFIFGRGGEEALALEKANVNWEVVPGITSAVAGPTLAGIPPTHRGTATSVMVVAGNNTGTMDWRSISQFSGTIIILMARQNAAAICVRLCSLGVSANRPAAIVEQASTPLQRTITGTVANISNKADDAGLQAPIVLVIGETVPLSEKLNRVEKSPLRGRHVVVTRARTQSSRLIALLENLGAKTTQLPTLRTTPIENNGKIDKILDGIDRFDWATFVSKNAVEYLALRLDTKHKDKRPMDRLLIAAIGPSTAKAVERLFGRKPDLQPDSFTAEEVAEEFSRRDIKPKRVLHPRSKIGKDSLPEKLREIGADVEEVPVYDTLVEKGSARKANIVYRGVSRPPDCTTFTSSSSVNNLLAILDGDAEAINKGSVVCIGPQTAETCMEAGVKVSRVAGTQSLEGLTQAVVEQLT